MQRRNVFPTIHHSHNSSPHFCRRTPAYTVALGNLLGIEGAEDTTPLFLKATRATGSRTARNRPVTQGAVCIGEDYD